MNEPVEEGAQEEQQSQEAPSKRFVRLPFILLPPLVVVEALVSHYVVTRFLASPPQAQVELAKIETKKEKPPQKGKPSSTRIYVIKDLIINPASTRGTRFFLVSLGLEYSPPGAEDRLSQQEPRIRDKLITVLAEKTLAQLSDITYREKLRKEINQAVQEVLGEDAEVHHIYFVKYVLQ